jgi:hypothetical protein
VVVATSVVVVAGGTQTGSGSRNTDVVVLATVEVVEEGFVDVVDSEFGSWGWFVCGCWSCWIVVDD